MEKSPSHSCLHLQRQGAHGHGECELLLLICFFLYLLPEFPSCVCGKFDRDSVCACLASLGFTVYHHASPLCFSCCGLGLRRGGARLSYSAARGTLRIRVEPCPCTGRRGWVASGPPQGSSGWRLMQLFGALF